MRWVLVLLLLATLVVLGAFGRAGSPKPPPNITLLSFAGVQQGGSGTYCWQSVCVDMVGVVFASQPLVVAAGEVVRLDFSKLGRLAHAEYQLYRYERAVNQLGVRGEQLILPVEQSAVKQGTLPREPIASIWLDVPPGRYVLTVFATAGADSHHARGDTTQGFNLEVGPGAATAGPVPPGRRGENCRP
ncbi:MAG TPA: hypothetical protein VFI42_12790 [Thermomicrobiaceae bacterium]|nr:hypothetical protein [Thermomicrobiaceae bacterium]